MNTKLLHAAMAAYAANEQFMQAWRNTPCAERPDEYCDWQSIGEYFDLIEAIAKGLAR